MALQLWMLQNISGNKVGHPLFQFMIADYDDLAIVELLKYGFPIGFAGKLNKKQGPIKNHRGVIEYPKEVQKYLEKE